MASRHTKFRLLSNAPSRSATDMARRGCSYSSRPAKGMPVLAVVPCRTGPAINIDWVIPSCSGNRSRACARTLPVITAFRQYTRTRTYFANLAPGVGSANNMTPWSSSVCSIRASLGALVGRLSCLRSQKRTARSSTPNAAPSERCVRPAKTRAARSWRPVTRFLL
jgi:hypothetical protein